MADEILYNGTVTSDTLNNIAIDLGNTSFNGFGTEKFGADELNGITASLVTKGILQSGDMCRPVLTNGKVNIQTGIIVFGNGAKKKITEVVSVDCINSTYIYALNNQSMGTCEIVVSETAPTEGDFVKLASVSSAGALTDLREISTAKVALKTGNNYFTVSGTTVNINPPGVSPRMVATLATIPRAQYDSYTYAMTEGAYKLLPKTLPATLGKFNDIVYLYFKEESDGNVIITGSFVNGGSGTITAILV